MNRLIILTVLSVLAIVALVLTSASQAYAASVIFRLDDVQDGYADNGTKAVMNLFLQKKVPLTTAIIGSAIGHDPGILTVTNTGIKSGLFEPALHGFRHVDYTTLTPNNQSVSITQGNTILKKLFATHPFIFVPPYNSYNAATLAALKSHDMNIISSTIGTEEAQHSESSIYNATVPCGNSDTGIVCQYPFRVSASNDFRTITDSNITQQTNKQILEEIADNVKHYGYSVVVLHPQDFVFVDKTGRVTKNQVNSTQVTQLSQLVDLVKKQYTPSSMSDLVAPAKAPSTSTGTTTKSITITQTAQAKTESKPKVAIITLDDDWIGQLKYGVPILKQNGFNATFFTTCKGPIAQDPGFIRASTGDERVNQSKDITTWDQLKQIHKMGFDIQNHGMTHHSLVDQPESILQREIVESKMCLDTHLGIHSEVFAPAFAKPEGNNTIDNLISRTGYEFARNGYGNGEWNSHRFNLPTNSMNQLDKDFNHNTKAIMPAFAEQLTKSELPVLVYHNINNLKDTEANWYNSTTTPETFAAEMKWLKDNGYQVHAIGDLRWDSKAGEFRLG